MTTPKTMPPRECPCCGEQAYYAPAEQPSRDFPGVTAGWGCMYCDNVMPYEEDDGYDRLEDACPNLTREAQP